MSLFQVNKKKPNLKQSKLLLNLINSPITPLFLFGLLLGLFLFVSQLLANNNEYVVNVRALSFSYDYQRFYTEYVWCDSQQLKKVTEMNLVSKILPRLHKTAVCADLFHPWSSQCSAAAAILWLDTLASAAKFSAALYMVQYLLKRSKDYKFLIRCFAGTVLHGSFSSVFYVCSNCFIRNYFNRFYQFWIGFGSGAISGIPVFFEHPSRRIILNITYLNMVLDVIFRHLEQNGFSSLTGSLKLRVSLFIVINTILLYKLQKNPQMKASTLWFYTPSESPGKMYINSKCHHIDPCWKNITKTAGIYFTLGTSLQLAKVVISSRKLGFPKLTDMGFPVFVAGYVSLYKVAICTLNQYQLNDSPSYEILGGIASGAAFWFYPSRSIIIAALGNLIQILVRDFKDARQLPDLPYTEIAFIIFNGLLYNCRILRPDLCPKFFINLVNLISNNRAQMMYTTFHKKINEAIQVENEVGNY